MKRVFILLLALYLWGVHTLFITRKLEPESPIMTWAERTRVRVVALSLLHFAPVSFRPPAQSDWWFFYSPRAVEFGAHRLALLSLPLPRLAAMGPGTAAALEAHEYSLKPSFIGEGSPVEVARAFGEIAAGQKVFFPRARQSRMTIQRLLQHVIQAKDAICYDNQAVVDPSLILANIFVFTSPLNVRTYLSAHPLPSDARIIAIGPSTAQALASFGVRCETAEESSEEGILAMLGKRE